MADYKTVSTKVAFYSLPPQTESDYETKAYEYSLNIPQVPQALPPSPLLSASQHPQHPQPAPPPPPPPPPFPPFQSSLPAPPPPLRRSRLPEAYQFPKSSYRYQMEDADINEIGGGYRYKMEDADINETEEDPRYNTQTYAFSLDHLNKAYTELINNRSRLSDYS
ncbi:hypothetical protein C1646_665048 [Rhizophagus diaphanus]|nr:hypothetical protein C1646_665048 [Rhizophagus diaphanus] [Rhizophagus sp. MUCL 43196]